MKKGLKLFHNGILKASTTPRDDEWLIFGINTYGEKCSCCLHRIGKSGCYNLYQSDVELHDKINIEICSINELHELSFSDEDFLNSFLLDRFNFLERELKGGKRVQNSLGFRCSINNESFTIPFAGNNRMGISINQNGEQTRLSAAGNSIIVESKFTMKSWNASTLNIGDEIVIELSNVTTESQPISVTECHLDQFTPMREEYERLRADLIKRGILT